MRKKLTLLTIVTLTATAAMPFTGYGAIPEPVNAYTFDGDIGDAVAIQRTDYYSDDALVESDGSSLSFSEGMLNDCVHLDGFEALKLDVDIQSETYSVSYWIKADRLSDCTPTLMITPHGFLAEKFVNVTLGVGGISPAAWTHMLDPYDHRETIGAPGILDDDEWMHITLVVDENMSKETLKDYMVEVDEFNTPAAIYLNGYLIDVGFVPKGLCIEDTGFWFGVNVWDDMYEGYLDELYFFDCALDEATVKELFIQSGGDPDTKKPVGNSTGGNHTRPNHGSVSDDYVKIEQGSIAGTNNHLNLDNTSPLATQGVETTTDMYAQTAFISGIALVIVGLGLFFQYLKTKRNSYC